MIFTRFLRFFTFAMIPLSILGPSLLMYDIGPIHILPHWLLITISVPLFVILLLEENLKLKLGLNIKRELRVKLYIYLLVFWLLYSMASVLWTDEKLLGVKEFILFFINIGLVLLIVFNLAEIKDLKLVLWFFCGILIINYFVAYLELFRNYHLPSSNLALYGGRLSALGVGTIRDIEMTAILRLKDFISGTFYNPNALGTFVGLTLPLIFSIFVRGSTKNYEKVLGLSLCVLGVILSIYLRSRTLYGVLLLVMIIYFCFYLKFREKVLLGCLIGFVIWELTRIGFPFSILTLSANDSSLITRVELFSMGKERFFYSFLLMGTGIGSFYDANLHNWYAEILFKFGFFIFIGYILFYLGILWNLYIISKKATNRALRFIGEGLFVSLSGYSIGCLSDSSRLLAFDSWIIFGLSLVTINIYRRKSESSRNYPLVSQ